LIFPILYSGLGADSEHRTGPFPEYDEQIADDFKMTDVPKINRLCDDSRLMMLA